MPLLGCVKVLLLERLQLLQVLELMEANGVPEDPESGPVAERWRNVVQALQLADMQARSLCFEKCATSGGLKGVLEHNSLKKGGCRWWQVLCCTAGVEMPALRHSHWGSEHPHSLRTRRPTPSTEAAAAGAAGRAPGQDAADLLGAAEPQHAGASRWQLSLDPPTTARPVIPHLDRPAQFPRISAPHSHPSTLAH